MPFKTTEYYNQLDDAEKSHVFSGLTPTKYASGISPVAPAGDLPYEGNLLFWWDASNSQRVLKNGSVVTDWISSSSLGYVSASTAGTAISVSSSAQNNKDILSFVDDGFRTNSQYGPYTTITYFFVWRLLNAGSEACYPFTMGYAEAIGNIFGIEGGPNGGGYPDSVDLFGAGGQDANFSLTDITSQYPWHLYTVTVDGNINTSTLRDKGVSATRNSAADLALQIGFNTNTTSGIGPTFGGSVDIAEVVVYNEVMTSNSASIESYLNDKWSIY